jgi:hypothetical protein
VFVSKLETSFYFENNMAKTPLKRQAGEPRQ